MDPWSTEDLYNNPVTAIYTYSGLWRSCVRQTTGFTECRPYFTILGLPGNVGPTQPFVLYFLCSVRNTRSWIRDARETVEQRECERKKEKVKKRQKVIVRENDIMAVGSHAVDDSENNKVISKIRNNLRAYLYSKCNEMIAKDVESWQGKLLSRTSIMCSWQGITGCSCLSWLLPYG